MNISDATASRRWLHHRPTRPRGRSRSASSRPRDSDSCFARCSPRTRSSRPMVCEPCRDATGRSVQARSRRVDGPGGLRARRVDLRHVRRQLELAWAGLVPAQLPDARVTPELGCVDGRRLHGRVPDRLRDADAPCATSRTTWPRRLVSIWLPDADGRRPVYGSIEKFQTDPDWRDLLQFHEYFHGDTGRGDRGVASDRLDGDRRRPDLPRRRDRRAAIRPHRRSDHPQGHSVATRRS